VDHNVGVNMFCSHLVDAACTVGRVAEDAESFFDIIGGFWLYATGADVSFLQTAGDILCGIGYRV